MNSLAAELFSRGSRVLPSRMARQGNEVTSLLPTLINAGEPYTAGRTADEVSSNLLPSNTEETDGFNQSAVMNGDDNTPVSPRVSEDRAEVDD